LNEIIKSEEEKIKKKEKIKINFTNKNIKILIKFIYNEEMNLIEYQMNEIIDFYKIFKEFEIFEITNLIEKYFEEIVNDENVVDIILFCKSYNVNSILLEKSFNILKNIDGNKIPYLYIPFMDKIESLKLIINTLESRINIDDIIKKNLEEKNEILNQENKNLEEKNEILNQELKIINENLKLNLERNENLNQENKELKIINENLKSNFSIIKETINLKNSNLNEEIQKLKIEKSNLETNSNKMANKIQILNQKNHEIEEKNKDLIEENKLIKIIEQNLLIEKENKIKLSNQNEKHLKEIIELKEILKIKTEEIQSNKFLSDKLKETILISNMKNDENEIIISSLKNENEKYQKELKDLKNSKK
jgi:hypothetical protein